MAYVYKLEVDESQLEISFNGGHEQASVVVFGMLKRKEDPGDWEDLTYINAKLISRWDEVDSLSVLQSELLECLSSYFTRHMVDMAALEIWLDETEFTEEQITFPEWPLPEE